MRNTEKSIIRSRTKLPGGGGGGGEGECKHVRDQRGKRAQLIPEL